ncbi:uncharacterized protein MKK02DRAFT_37690 [Dioszegia hungarica]|uniref:Uncharacterized protein n=1 Tax=Dioszegia hungarica TaxID=4972 RepID=A0AA38LTF8_9TREE|nr:uncharacterized protein MKK02DRAFT_37690 [Dioszegia hungarica]KAI9634815.1 hypothetical protein MKK02DRAFT_37690 [Dioszegia hungarica]
MAGDIPLFLPSSPAPPHHDGDPLTTSLPLHPGVVHRSGTKRKRNGDDGKAEGSEKVARRTRGPNRSGRPSNLDRMTEADGPSRYPQPAWARAPAGQRVVHPPPFSHPPPAEDSPSPPPHTAPAPRPDPSLPPKARGSGSVFRQPIAAPAPPLPARSRPRASRRERLPTLATSALGLPSVPTSILLLPQVPPRSHAPPSPPPRQLRTVSIERRGSLPIFSATDQELGMLAAEGEGGYRLLAERSSPAVWLVPAVPTVPGLYPSSFRVSQYPAPTHPPPPFPPPHLVLDEDYTTVLSYPYQPYQLQPHLPPSTSIGTATIDPLHLSLKNDGRTRYDSIAHEPPSSSFLGSYHLPPAPFTAPLIGGISNTSAVPPRPTFHTSLPPLPHLGNHPAASRVSKASECLSSRSMLPPLPSWTAPDKQIPSLAAGDNLAAGDKLGGYFSHTPANSSIPTFFPLPRCYASEISPAEVALGLDANAFGPISFNGSNLFGPSEMTPVDKFPLDYGTLFTASAPHPLQSSGIPSWMTTPSFADPPWASDGGTKHPPPPSFPPS